MLPWFGGSAGVWTTCMLFFQTVLLAGYLYANWSVRRLSPRFQVLLHVALLAASLSLLPVAPSFEAPLPKQWPILQILLLLTLSAGLPCLLLSTTGPLVQAWYARTQAGASPYRLFALSNAASLAALLSYPLAVEPFLWRASQLRGWSFAYAAFVVLAAWSALQSRKGNAVPAIAPGAPAASRLLWIALAAAPSALWLAVVNQMSQSAAAIPLLWILPLSLYLLSFILCFHRDSWYQPSVFSRLLPAAVPALIAAIKLHDWSGTIVWGLLLFNGGLFVCCMFCLGELARRRPPAQELTAFYLMVALGGVLGAVFVGLVAPVLFSDYLELPVSIAACVLLALGLLYGCSPLHVARVAVISLAAFAVAVPLQNRSAFRTRSFYGVLEVRDKESGAGAYRELYNGTILHGSQFLAPERSREATTYYSRASGAGRELLYITRKGRRVGVIGLGVGTLAAYAREGDYFRFYEIDPMVIRLARSRFRFLSECRGKEEVIEGDARLALDRELPQEFDLLAVDAFSGDAIPVHLLTREAFSVYRRHLRPGGVLAVHVSSKYFDLVPMVRDLAAASGLHADVVHNSTDPYHQVAAATWVIVKGGRAPAPPSRRLWTDDYTNLLALLK